MFGIPKVFAADGADVIVDYQVQQTWAEKVTDNLHPGGKELSLSRTLQITVKDNFLSIAFDSTVLWNVILPTKPANEYEYEEYARKCGSTAKSLIILGRYRPMTEEITFEKFLLRAGVARVNSASDLVGNLPWFYGNGM